MNSVSWLLLLLSLHLAYSTTIHLEVNNDVNVQCGASAAQPVHPYPVPSDYPIVPPPVHVAMWDFFVKNMDSLDTWINFLDLMQEDAEWCDPFPTFCFRGKPAIEALLRPENMKKHFRDISGQFWGQLLFQNGTGGGWIPNSVESTSTGCVVGTRNFVEWELGAEIDEKKPRKSLTGTVKAIRWYYDTQSLTQQDKTCSLIDDTVVQQPTQPITDPNHGFVHHYLTGVPSTLNDYRTPIENAFDKIKGLLETPIDQPGWIDPWMHLFTNRSTWCDPYPVCHPGLDNIRAFLNFSVEKFKVLRMDPQTPIDVSGNIGGRIVSFYISWYPDYCLTTTHEHMWLTIDPEDTTKLLNLNFFFIDNQWAGPNPCYGPGSGGVPPGDGRAP